jgi:2-methylcitrate dehydratase PrpD
VEPYSQAIARFVRELNLEDVPQPVMEKAKLVFLDTLGVALASSTMDFGRMAMNVAQKLGGTTSSRFDRLAVKGGRCQRCPGQRHPGSWLGL